MGATSPTATALPAAIYVWLVPSEDVQEQPGSWRIRMWDTEPFPEANFALSKTTDSKGYAPSSTREIRMLHIWQALVRIKERRCTNPKPAGDSACECCAHHWHYIEDAERQFGSAPVSWEAVKDARRYRALRAGDVGMDILGAAQVVGEALDRACDKALARATVARLNEENDKLRAAQSATRARSE